MPHVRHVCVLLPLGIPHVRHAYLGLHIGVRLKGRRTRIWSFSCGFARLLQYDILVKIIVWYNYSFIIIGHH